MIISAVSFYRCAGQHAAPELHHSTFRNVCAFIQEWEITNNAIARSNSTVGLRLKDFQTFTGRRIRADQSVCTISKRVLHEIIVLLRKRVMGLMNLAAVQEK